MSPRSLVEQLKGGLDAPICLTWELTYACNLACVHCLSSSGRRDPRELTTAEAKAVLDELRRLQVFYINIGGGEPMIRKDFFELVTYAVDHGIGVKFSTNGTYLDAAAARRLTAMDYIDVQISLDGVDAVDQRPGARRRLLRHGPPGDGPPRRRRVRAVQDLRRRHPPQRRPARRRSRRWPTRYGAQLRVTRLRPSGRGADSWHELHPTNDQQHQIYRWLLAHGEDVLTGDSFFHLNALGEPLPGLNMCGAGRVVCLIDPIGDVYACPFVIHDEFKAGSVRDPGGFTAIWRESELFLSLREPQSAGACASCGSYDACQGGCMAAKFFTGLPLDGPDPECVNGHGEALLAGVGAGATPRPAMDHSRRPPPPARSRSSAADPSECFLPPEGLRRPLPQQTLGWRQSAGR